MLRLTACFLITAFIFIVICSSGPHSAQSFATLTRLTNTPEHALNLNPTISDDGRGIPVDKHPRFKTKSAAEIVLTTLHAGGKFEGKGYQVSGGLHGVGVSVVNAVSERLVLEIVRDGTQWYQEYQRGKPKGDRT